MKKRNTVALLLAIIVSIILVPCVVAFGLSAASVKALSDFVSEGREEELYAILEKEDGIALLYENVEGYLKDTEKMMKQSGTIPADAEIFQDVITYEDINAIVHGAYHAFINGNVYTFQLARQKEIIKKNIEEYFEKYLKEQHLYVPVITEEIMEGYLKEPFRQVDQEIATLEQQLNEIYLSLYEVQSQPEVRKVCKMYGEDTISLSLIQEGLKKATEILFVTTIVMLLLLLAAHLFRPSGFFVAGGCALLIGGSTLVISGGIRKISVLKMILTELPETGFLTAELVYTIEEWMRALLCESYRLFGAYSAFAGGLLILMGVALFITIRSRESRI